LLVAFECVVEHGDGLAPAIRGDEDFCEVVERVALKLRGIRLLAEGDRLTSKPFGFIVLAAVEQALRIVQIGLSRFFFLAHHVVQLGQAHLHAEVLGFDFEQAVRDALDALPPELRDAMSNVDIVVDEDAPPDSSILGLYQGIPLTRRGSGYGGVLPDKITIYRRPIERVAGRSPERLREEIHHVVLHEIAHHFGISDERLIELGKY